MRSSRWLGCEGSRRRRRDERRARRWPGWRVAVVAALGAVGGGFIAAGTFTLALCVWFADVRWGATGVVLLVGGLALILGTGAWRA